MKKTLLILFLLVVPLAGCSTVPKNGSVLNQKVSEGINKNQVEVEKIIKALANVERAILDQEWDNIYIKVEKAYITKHSVAATASLTQDQRKAIAANAAKIYYDLLGEIATIERTLVAQTQTNSKTLVEINDEVTKYLLSVEKLDLATSNIKNKLASLAGIDLSIISGLAKNLIGGI